MLQMNHAGSFVALAAAAAAATGSAASAGTVPASPHMLVQEAEWRIVGAGPTASGPVGQNLPGGGQPLYLPDRPRLNGVVGLIMNYGTNLATGLPFLASCSGSLIPGGNILTAAHCVRTRTGVSSPVPTVTAHFYGGAADIRYYFDTTGNVTLVPVASIHIHPDWTGRVIDQADIAILKLGAAAPDFAEVYKLSTITDLTGRPFNMAGLGLRSFAGGSQGTSAPFGAPSGWLRQGWNRFDYRYGDPDFGGFFLQPSWFGPEAAHVWLADFDNGRTAQDLACALASFFVVPTAKHCNLGRGALEANTAGGDSGGPQFIFGRQIVSVTSFGQRYSVPSTDVDDALNSSFGEFAGFAPVAIHRDWISRLAPGAFVPEPATWAMLIAGFGLIGIAARRRSLRAAAA